MTPSLCGGFLTDKRSLIAFTWTLTTLLTILAMIAAAVMVLNIHTQYLRLDREQQEYYNYDENKGNEHLRLLLRQGAFRFLEGGEGEEGEGAEGEEGEEHASGDDPDDLDDEDDYGEAGMASMTSQSMTFTAVYTICIAIGLLSYGSTAIVGFTSLQGVYIQPCFSSSGSTSKLKLGIFGGAVVFFANLLLVCAVVLGEVRVEDWKDRRDNGEEREPYEVEKISAILAVTCMFLAALYTVFAVLLFLYYGSDDDLDDDLVDPTNRHHTPTLPSITNDPRRENFITMDDT